MSSPPDPGGGPFTPPPTGPPQGYPDHPPAYQDDPPPDRETPPRGTPPPGIPAGHRTDSPLTGRLHPTAIPIWASQQGVGLVLLLLFGGGPGGFGLLLVSGALLVAAVASAIRWHRFRWSVEEGNLVIEQGLIQQSRRVIPADRVQSVDLVRPVRHRLLRVVQVRVEAIGGRDSEGVLEALDEPTAFAIQRALIGARAARRAARQPDGAGPQAGAAPSTAPRQLASVSGAELVIAGVTGGRVGVVALLLGGVQQVFGDRFEELFSRLPTNFGPLTVVLFAVAVVGLVFVLSIVATVVTYWDFTVMRDDDELRISRGLLEQRLETIPIARIQSLRIEQNLLRRALGMASVKADLAGRAASGTDAGTGLLMPIGRVDDARRLVADLLGSGRPVAADLLPPPSRSRRRYVARGAAVGLVILLATLPLLLVGVPGWVPFAAGLAASAVGIPVGVSWWRALGSAQIDGVLVARTGLLVRRRVHVPVARVQRLSVQSTPFQRRLGLADVRIGIARSGGWEGPRMPELDSGAALELLAGTVHELSTTRGTGFDRGSNLEWR